MYLTATLHELSAFWLEAKPGALLATKRGDSAALVQFLCLYNFHCNGEVEPGSNEAEAGFILDVLYAIVAKVGATTWR